MDDLLGFCSPRVVIVAKWLLANVKMTIHIAVGVLF